MKRLVCLLLLATIVIVGIAFGTPAGRNITSNLRSGQAGERIPFSGKNEAAYSKYDDMDWDELPLDVQQAAHVLGYNKGAWDHGENSEHFSNDWWDLTAEQRTAATTLGYDEVS